MRKNGGLTCEAQAMSLRDILCELGLPSSGFEPHCTTSLLNSSKGFMVIENRIKHKLSMKKQIERTKTNLDFEREREIRSFQSKGKNNFVS